MTKRTERRMGGVKIRFTVLGEPQGKGRPKFSRQGNRVVTRTPDQTVLYENLIQMEYLRQCGKARFEDNECLDMRIMAYYTIPSSISKKKRQSMIDKEIRPTKKPDADNIVKVVADSLNQVAYKDDSQIVDTMIRKYYSEQPRIEVVVQTANE